jgi:hypothetical protein
MPVTSKAQPAKKSESMAITRSELMESSATPSSQRQRGQRKGGEPGRLLEPPQ